MRCEREEGEARGLLTTVVDTACVSVSLDALAASACREMVDVDDDDDVARLYINDPTDREETTRSAFQDTF